MPVGMSKAQAVVMGEKVYIGGGVTDIVSDFNQVLQYDPSRDEWSRLPPHHIVAFGMAQFEGNLITVGYEMVVLMVKCTASKNNRRISHTHANC